MATAHPVTEQLTIMPPAERREAVLRVIRSARKRLLMSMYRCTDYRVIDELAETVNRGVRVELLLTPRATALEARKLRELGTLVESIGAEVYRYHDPLVKYHAKYMVADDGPALVASLNFTEKCFTATGDFVLVTHDPEVISSLKRLFETDSVAPEARFPDGITERLIVGPDRARAQFTTLLEQAQKSIRIVDHKVADPMMISLLREKKDAGVTVDILGSGGLGGLRSHGKMLLIDDHVAVIGSIGLASMSLDFRREVAIVIRKPECVRQLSEFFESVAGAQKQSPAASAEAEDSEDED
ncbi:MAG: hypothetical protein HY238_13045 [Acidobacteria bacterium]|nr:hypothetical protein [Acidobacteriota bacterium]